MNTKIDTTGKKLTEDDIARAEIGIGHKIPPIYKDFLLSTNGGHPKLSEFSFIDPDGTEHPASLSFFLGIDVTTGISLNFYIKNYKNRIPLDLFPIACDPGGNIICIGTSDERLGKIYFWDHEEEVEEGKTPTYQNIYFIANSLESFLENLH